MFVEIKTVKFRHSVLPPAYTHGSIIMEIKMNWKEEYINIPTVMASLLNGDCAPAAFFAKVLNYPTEGNFAWELWQALSRSGPIDVNSAKEFYLQCGYLPFCGYPLVQLQMFWPHGSIISTKGTDNE
jgi:hypothetical protein